MTAANIRLSTSSSLVSDRGRGARDVFEVGPMAGGWDEVKLAGKGVPVRGNLDITLRVTGVGHHAP